MAAETAPHEGIQAPGAEPAKSRRDAQMTCVYTPDGAAFNGTTTRDLLRYA